MRVGSLFSGVGGLDLGLARAGFRHAFFCESDSYRRDVLRAHWPGVPVYDDVRDVALSDAGRGGVPRAGGPAEREQGVGGRERGSEAAVDLNPGRGEHADLHLLCGGFPCQDLSVAGQRRGLAGERSGLFHEFARIINTVRPGWLLIENVPGLLSSNGGRDFGIVLGTLADLGYGVAWRVLDSRFFGVPQRRRRVFIVGAVANGDPRAAAERAGQVLAVGTRCTGHSQKGREAGPDVATPLGGSVGNGRGHDGNPFDRGGHSSLSGMGNGGPDDNDAQAGRLVSYALNGKRGNRDDGESETFVTHALTSEGHDASEDGTGRGTPLVGFSHTQGLDAQPSTEAWPSLRREGGGHAVGNATGVRRLTPTECERLQAWPDGWTDLGGTPDSRRYAACGDGVTSSVSEWIGRRLMEAA